MHQLLKIVFCALLILSFGCSKKAEPPKPPITITFDVFPGFGHVLLAEAKGIFKKNGVNVKLLMKKEYLSVKQAFIENSTDAACVVYPAVIMAAERGADYKVIYLCDYSFTADVIIGRPELKSMADLKGKTISFEGVNSFSNIFVLSALEKNHIHEYEVKFANLRASEVLDALDTGKIYAGHVWEPFKTRAMKQGYKVLAQAEDVPIGILADTLVIKNSLIQERPHDIYLIVKSLFEALDYIRIHPEESMEIIAKEAGISVEETKAGFEGVHHPNVQENADLLTSKIPPSLYASETLILDFYLKRGQISGIHETQIDEILYPRFVEDLAYKKGDH